MKPREMTIRSFVALVAAAATTLLLGPSPASAATQTFPNPTPIQIPAGGATASSYPSQVSVSGATGPVTDVNVTLHRVGQNRPDLFKALLVSPSGEKVNLMNSNCGSAAIEDFTWVLDQEAANPMPRGASTSCPDFLYRPDAFASTASMPAPAPASPYRTTLDAFSGENPNGAWKLFVDGDSGDLEGGWSLTLSTGEADVALPAAGTSGPADPYPVTRQIADEGRVLTDLDVTIQGVWHQRPSDLDLLLVGPEGQSVTLMSSSCGTYEVAAYGWTWNDEAPSGFMPVGDGTDSCSSSSYRPTDRSVGDSWPSPAPSGPRSATLSAFDLTDPSGEWKLYANDTATGAVGFLNRFNLTMSTRDKARVAFSEAAVTVAEGGTRELTLTRTAPGELGAGKVVVRSLPGSAISPGDYTPILTTVEFAAGEREKTVRLDALADDQTEPDEIYAVAIISATGDAVAGSPSSVEVTIPGPPAPPSDPPITPTDNPRSFCGNAEATISGTDGPDVLRGSRGPDVIAGLGGDDVIKVTRGNDTVCGGGGSDRISGGPGKDRLSGGAGKDRCLGGPGRDRTQCERSR